MNRRSLALALGCGLASATFAAGAGTAPATPPTTRPGVDIRVRPALGAPHVPQAAVYRWGVPKGVAQVDAFAAWAKLPNVWMEDFEPSDTWDNIANPGWAMPDWQRRVTGRPGRRLILSVPMLPGHWDRTGTDRGMGAHQKVSLEEGAKGTYNDYFKTLATQLVAHHLGNSVIRLGWEMNGGWYTWRASDNPKAWAEYWRQIAQTMRRVPGAEHLLFCWNPATCWLQFPAEQSWPGDAAVDLVGIDVYDQSWAPGTYPIPAKATPAERLAAQKKAWTDWNYDGNHGLHSWIKFAAAHNKPLAICEWGVCDRTDGHGGGDDPYFIQQMHDVIADPANGVVLQCYFDVNAGDGAHQLSPGSGANKVGFPESAALYLKLFGGN